MSYREIREIDMTSEKVQMANEISRINGGNGTLAMPNKLLLTFDEASRTLNVSRGLLRKLARLGRIRVTRIGRCARISREEILRLCDGQALGGAQ